MALPKGNLTIEERDGLGFKNVTLKDVYFQSIDVAGIMTNSSSDGRGRIKFYPMARVLSTDMDPPPMVPTASPIVMARPGGVPQPGGGRRGGLDG